MVERGLSESREKAKAWIMAGEVKVGDHVVNKASDLFTPDALITIKMPDKYVGRGGLKMECALDYFKLNPAGWRVLDIGASTGGFTDCLLQRKAAEVVALDVGHGQIHWKIRTDARVKVVEGKNARQLEPGEFGPPFDLVVMDVSFISQELIWPRIPAQLKDGGFVITLVKPQFEAGVMEVGKGGIVRDPGVQQRVVKRIWQVVENEIGLEVKGVTESSILGKDGNREFLLCATRSKK